MVSNEPKKSKAGFRFVGVRQVAAEAGVSIGTVSNVLNRPEIVGEETLSKVRDVMDRLGFVPSIAAGQLRGHRSKQIGVVVPDVGNPYWSSVLRGVESVIEAEHLTMLVSSTHQDKKRQRSILKAHRSQGVDGLIHVPIYDSPEDWEEFGNCTYGVVTLDHRRGGSEIEESVGADDVLGAKLAMSHLLEIGHRTIGFINGPHFVPWCASRAEGARSAIAAFESPRNVQLIEMTVRDLTVNEGREAARKIIDNPDITAVMCGNDMTALGVLLTCQELGILVPDELSIVGYDDVDFAPALNPPLTTVRQPSYLIGVAAACQLLNKPFELRDEPFRPELIVRNSTMKIY
ncbi:LacI family DNA-binding transcriptional regulator [Schaalia sp. ZJ405]|uniref:LacI family DNA-binding transcriptional regulator n=1 Tax=Schaalia sp. ZJ405 TaxID=2709403 RepID=UPI0013EC8F49|nr:LacI family DNA-binding transcriptional regulator [Schaalia sp. ZJ405]QPK80943.1 LacI family DNA-binding transcriptional regulator [Schaalia sp. ZJ405]